MKALDFPVLADENVHPEVIGYLRKAGMVVDSIAEQGNFGLSDTEVLQQATEVGRIILTHDSDFGDWRSWEPNLSGSSIFALVTFEQTLPSKRWKQFEITRPK